MPLRQCTLATIHINMVSNKRNQALCPKFVQSFYISFHGLKQNFTLNVRALHLNLLTHTMGIKSTKVGTIVHHIE
jgi:hypothetical protein